MTHKKGRLLFRYGNGCIVYMESYGGTLAFSVHMRPTMIVSTKPFTDFMFIEHSQAVVV